MRKRSSGREEELTVVLRSPLQRGLHTLQGFGPGCTPSLPPLHSHSTQAGLTDPNYNEG